MQFEIAPRGWMSASCAAQRSETGPYLDITCNEKFILGKVPPPTHLPCPCVLSDKPVGVRVSQLADGGKHCRLRIEVVDEENREIHQIH